MVKKSPIIIILFGLAFIAYQYLYLTKENEIDFYSLFSEGFIAITIFVLLINLHSFRNNKSIYNYLNLGFSLLFIALLTDTLDEIFYHPKLLTTILEDICQALGFIIVLIGISKWIKFNDEQNEELRSLATTDELTGLFNRRYFHEKAFEEFNRSQRTKSNFSILMIDIDHFKSINDKYSYSVGDSVLQKFSNEIKNSTRKTDIIARWGGDEFMVLLIDIDNDICSRISENIRQIIESLLVATGDEVINFTVSIGAAISSDKDDSADVLIYRAGKLLYEAKQNGGNCIALDFSNKIM